MIIDSHVHFWNFDPIRDNWITENMQVIRRDFLPENLAPLLAENNISGCIAVQADQSPAETQFLLDLAENNDFIKGVVGWISLENPEIGQQLESYATEKKLKGFRHIAEGERQGFLLQDRILAGIEALGALGYTYDILVRQHQLHDAIALAEKLPGQPFVIDHCAKPNLKDDNLFAWKDGMATLAQNPNVYCKLSGLLTEGHWHNCNETAIFECLDVIFKNFGTHRILFGSDWPVMLLGGHYTQWLGLIKKYTAQFTNQEQQAIFAGNAASFYKI
jgi:L-fuconolactonase